MKVGGGGRERESDVSVILSLGMGGSHLEDVLKQEEEGSEWMSRRRRKKTGEEG